MEREMINGRFMLLGDAPRSGGQSEVRKAIDATSASGDFAAIKLLKQIQEDELIETFLERETETLKALRHPNIVRLLDSGWSQTRGQHFLALEWVDRSLKDDRDGGKEFDWPSYFEEIARPLASALAHAHSREIEHRDIKPGNVLITADGFLKLADFGIAKIRSKITDPTQTVAAFRSGLYAPPDLDDSVPYIRDVFAFGVLAVQVLSGERAVEYSDLAPVLDGLHGIPHEFRTILQACIALDREDRPENCAVLEQRLLEAQQVCGDRQARDGHAIWIKLTRGAAASLTGVPKEGPVEFAQAEAIVLSDLSDVVHVDYGFNAESKETDKDTLVLVGRSWCLKLISDSEYSDRTLIVFASAKDEVWLARWRERACLLGRKLRWSFTDPGEDVAYKGLNLMLDLLDQHRADKDAAEAARDSHSLGDLLDGWRRLLDAREDLARGQRKPLAYESFTRKGRTVEFQLYQSCDTEMLGDDWEVAESAQGRPTERGEVVKQSETAVDIRFRRPGVKLPPRGVLVPYLGPSRTALQRQYDALANVSADQTANPLLRSIIEDPESLTVGAATEIPSWLRQDLDPSKRDVVRHALGSQDLLLVEGPPGTGKTTVIAEIVRQTLRRDSKARILIVSQTHIAIDNALQRLEQAGISGLVRLGRADDPRVAANAQHLLLDKQLKRWSREVRTRAATYLDKLASQSGQNARHLQAALSLGELTSVLANMEHVRKHIEDLSGQPAPERTTAARSFAEEIVTARGRLDDLADQRAEIFTRVLQQLQGDLTLRDNLTVDEAQAAVDALIGASHSGPRLMELLSLQGDWLQRIETDQQLEGAFLKTCQVVAGTAIGFLGRPAARDLEFDLCIFDEASKATATEALVPMARARRWILVGDTRQLPPMHEDLLRDEKIMNDHQLTPELVETTLFQYLVERTQPPVRHLLREQYRMVPAIGNLISTVFYDEQLLSPSKEQLPGYGDLNKPVLWLDTSRLGTERRESERTAGNRSIANRAEVKQAIMRLEILDKAISRGLIRPSNGTKLDVLLIAPYGRQVEELKRRLATVSLSHMVPDVLSVDAVQGRECDLAVFTVTRSNDRSDFGFLGQPYWRRINVALSRARFGLIVVGDAEFCRGKPGALSDVLQYMREHPEECEIREADRV
ncbi:serine/threonine-protein kinase [Streptomyces sp. H39-C1]|uniref:serine/threonine-protein kinase n=1 Tax=Streptomyces sp. H39-C1 TaxID=3004355 RepID=UPI0022B040F0|nr:serine/threonine-protein kinase [Streptomyces sp. H39-C1]MCZ4103042.1 AAA domain-containing protein [Streptomyces sp. H39-C1]